MAPQKMTARNKRTGKVYQFMWDGPQPPTSADIRRLQFEQDLKDKEASQPSLLQRATTPLIDWGTKLGQKIGDAAHAARSYAETKNVTPEEQGLASLYSGKYGGHIRSPQEIRDMDAAAAGFIEGAAPAAGETVDSFTSPMQLGLLATGGSSAILAGRAAAAARAGKTVAEVNRLRNVGRALSGVEAAAGGGFMAHGGGEVYGGLTDPRGTDWGRVWRGTTEAAGGGAMALGGGQRIRDLGRLQPPVPDVAPPQAPTAPAAQAPAPAPPSAAPKPAAAPATAQTGGLPKVTVSKLKKLGYADTDIAGIDLKSAADIIANKTVNPKAAAPAPAPAPAAPPAAPAVNRAALVSKMETSQLKSLADLGDADAAAELQRRSTATAPTGDQPQAPTPPPPPEVPTGEVPPVEDPALRLDRLRQQTEEAEAARLQAAKEEFLRKQAERQAAAQPPAPPEVPPVENPVPPVNRDVTNREMAEFAHREAPPEDLAIIPPGGSLVQKLAGGKLPGVKRTFEEPPEIEPPAPIAPPPELAPAAPPPVADPLAELEALARNQPKTEAAEPVKRGRKPKVKADPEMLSKFNEAIDSTETNPEATGIVEDLARNYAQARGLSYEDGLAQLTIEADKARPKAKAQPKPKASNGTSTSVPPELQRVNWIKVLDKVRQVDPSMNANKMMEQAKALHAQGITPEQIVTMAVKEDPGSYMMGAEAPKAVPDVAPPVTEPPKPRLVKKEGGALVREGAEGLSPEEAARLKAEMEGPGEVENPAPPKPVPPVEAPTEAKPANLGKAKPIPKEHTQREFWDNKLQEAEADVRAWRAEISGKRADPTFDKARAMEELKNAEETAARVKGERQAWIDRQAKDQAALARRKASGQSGSAVNPLGMAKELYDGLRDKLSQWKEEMRGRGLSEDEIAQAVRDAAERHIREQNEVSPPAEGWTPELENERWERDNPNSTLRKTTTNASGESAASAEAQSRARGMAARGEQYGIVERDGRWRRLLTQDDADSVRLKPGQTKIVRGENGSVRVLDGDGSGLAAFEKLEARRRGGEGGSIRNPFAREPKEPPPLDVATAEELKDVPSFEDIQKPDTLPKGPKPPKPKEVSNPKWRPYLDQFENWVRARRASSVEGELAARDFRDLDAAGSKAIIGYARGKRGGKLANVEKLFDDMYNKLRAAGVRVGYRADYMPQMWEHPRDEVLQTSRRLGLKPRFAEKRIIENYEQGIQLGWKPKMKTVSELVQWYVRSAQKAIADRQFFTYLKNEKLILPSSKAPAQWVTIDNFPFHKVINKGEVISRSWKARPEVAKMINNYLGAPEEHIHAMANVGQVTKNMALSSGIPWTAINAHGFNMVIRNAMGHSGVLKGTMEAANWLVRPGQAGKWIEENLHRAPFAIKHGLTMGIEVGGKSMSKDIVEEMTEGWHGKVKGAVKTGADKLMAAHDVMFEKPLFQKVIPALKLKHFYALMEDLKKQGMGETEAAKTAAKATNELYGGIDWESMGRNRTFQDLLRGTLLASDWAETSVRLGKGITKTIANPKKFMAPENTPYRNAMKGLFGLYATANVMNYMTSGHFMWDNDPGHAFDIEMGSTEVGGKKKKRWIRTFGTAADMARLPVDVVAGIKNGDLGTGFDIIKNRLGFAPRAVVDFISNKDKQGRPIHGKDAYGRQIPRSKQLGAIAGELTDVATPQYVGSAIDLLTGRSNLEMALTRGAEVPVRYSAEPKPRGGSRYSNYSSRYRRR